jgi:hypothetical protein
MGCIISKECTKCGVPLTYYKPGGYDRMNCQIHTYTENGGCADCGSTGYGNCKHMWSSYKCYC